jgi:hypothetical protein
MNSEKPILKATLRQIHNTDSDMNCYEITFYLPYKKLTGELVLRNVKESRTEYKDQNEPLRRLFGIDI